MVRNQGALRLDNPWSRIGWMSFAAIVLASSLLGFVILSRYQANSEPLDIWAAICRGLGITADTSAAVGPQPPLRTPTDLAWTQTTLDQIRAGNAERGAFVALNCAACHEGSAANPAHLIPMLDGMDAEAIFKQLADYRSGKRLWGVMNAIARALSVQDLADVATYFAGRLSKISFVGTLVIAFLTQNITKVSMFAGLGMLNTKIWTLELYLLPLMFVGGVAGKWVNNSIHETQFARWIFFLILAACIKLLVF